MTSDEIRNASTHDLPNPIMWLREIALQLALLNEGMRGVRADIQAIDNSVQCVEQAVRIS